MVRTETGAGVGGEVVYVVARQLRWTRNGLGGQGHKCRETVLMRCRHPLVRVWLRYSERSIMGGVFILFLHWDGGGGDESRMVALEGHAAATFRSEMREVLEGRERGGARVDVNWRKMEQVRR